MVSNLDGIVQSIRNYHVDYEYTEEKRAMIIQIDIELTQLISRYSMWDLCFLFLRIQELNTNDD